MLSPLGFNFEELVKSQKTTLTSVLSFRCCVVLILFLNKIEMIRSLSRVPARLKGEVQNRKESQPSLRGLTDASRSAGGAPIVALVDLESGFPGNDELRLDLGGVLGYFFNQY